MVNLNMKKTNFIWILALFLLAVPMAFAEIPDYYVLIEADDLNTWTNNNNIITQIASDKWLITSNSINNASVQRAEIMESLFYDLKADNDTIINVSGAYTNQQRDNDKRGIYYKYYVQQPNDDNYCGYSVVVTLNGSAGDNSSWWCYGKTSSYCSSTSCYGRFYYPSGSSALCSADYNIPGPSDEPRIDSTLSTDTININNPTNFTMTASGASYTTIAYGYAEAIILSEVAINYSIETQGYCPAGGTHTITTTDFLLNESFPAFSNNVLLINALDNYTKYGYQQSNITNFTATLTNGTDTIIEVANYSEYVAFTNITGLWNITLSHDEYNNRTYLNYNVSEDLTAYMYQTHLHSITDCAECVTSNVCVMEEYPDLSNSDCIDVYMRGGTPYYDQKIKSYVGYNAIGNMSAIVEGNLSLYRYSVSSATTDAANLRERVYSSWYNVSTATWNNQPVLDTTISETNTYRLWNSPWPLGWFNFNISSGTFGGTFYADTSITCTWCTGNLINLHNRQIGAANAPYINATMSSNFTIAVFDAVDNTPITTTDITINISNGVWSREDILSGTNTISYPFDQGIYDISVIVEGVEQTHSNYDLATENNYLSESFAFYFNITNCSSASSNIALNFTFRDEENQSAINGGLTPDFTLSTDFYNTTYSADLADNVTNIYLCLDPDDVSVTLEWPSFVEYQPTDTGNYGYTRFYYFSNMIIRGDSTQDISLFNLEDSLSSQTTFNMQKEGQNVAQGLIQVLRYYAAEQTSKVVAMKPTSSNGQATERVRQGDALYNIFAFDADLAICYVTPTAEELGSSLSIYCDTSGVSSDYWPLWLLYHYVSYDFTYNNVTNVTTLTWAGVTGAPTQARFRVTKIGGASETEVCDSTSTSTSGTLDCTLTDLDATYNLEFIAQLTYGATSGYFILASEFLELKQNLSDLIGKDGTFLAIFIIGLLAFTGLFNPAAAVLLATLGVVITSLMGLIPLGLGALVAIILTGGIIAVKMRT